MDVRKITAYFLGGVVHASSTRLCLEFTQSSIQRAPIALSPAVKELWYETNHTHTPLMPILRISAATRVVPKVMINFFLYANWEQQTKESAVVDGTSCCVILECLVTSIAYIT